MGSLTQSLTMKLKESMSEFNPKYEENKKLTPEEEEEKKSDLES